VIISGDAEFIADFLINFFESVILARVMRQNDQTHARFENVANIIVLDVGRDNDVRAVLFRKAYRSAVHARAAKGRRARNLTLRAVRKKTPGMKFFRNMRTKICKRLPAHIVNAAVRTAVDVFVCIGNILPADAFCQM